MRKTLLTLTALIAPLSFCAFEASAADAVIPIENMSSDWAKKDGVVFTGNGSKAGMSMIGHSGQNSNNEVFYMYDFYTKEDFSYTQYGEDGEKFYGFPNSKEVNGNPNMGINKIDRDGNLIWTVYSDRGYFDKGQSKIAPTEDGGAIVALKVRLADRKEDADGKKSMIRMHTSKDASYSYLIEEPELPVNADLGWIYRCYLLKLDNNGKVEWKKDFKFDYTTIESGGTKRSRANMMDFCGITVGPDNHIYVAGRFASPLTIGDKTYQPTNIPENWNYDFVQSGKAGDMFLAKFDIEGNCNWVMTHEKGSKVLNENVSMLASDNEAVYVTGYIKANSGSTEESATFGGKTATLTNDRNSLFFMKLDCEKNATATDETVALDYFKIFKCSKGQNKRQNMKPMHLAVSKEEGVNDLVISGSFEGLVEDENGTVVIANEDRKSFPFLKAFVIDIDKTTGSLINSTASEDFMEFESAHVLRDSIYATGYSGNDIKMISYYKPSMEPEKIYITSSEQAMCTHQASYRCGNKMVMLNRSGAETTLYGGLPSMPMRSKWDLMINGFTISGIDDTPTSVETVEESSFGVFGGQGFVNISAWESCNVNIYSISGALVRTFAAPVGTTTVELPAGFYIVNGTKVAVR